MKRPIKFFLLAIALTTSFFFTPSIVNACRGSSPNGYYGGLEPGYYGSTYYGGGLIYYPNSPFFYSVGPGGYFTDGDCSRVPGVTCGGYRHYARHYYSHRVYMHCTRVRGHHDKHGCWIRTHKICRY